MKKIMFNTKLGLEQAVLEGRKTQTRRLVQNEFFTLQWDVRDDTLVVENECGDFIDIRNTKFCMFKVGEIVSVAQKYTDCGGLMEDGTPRWKFISRIAGEKNGGWSNKMFIRPELMPHQIIITNVRIERLQDISDEDCLAEGIERMPDGGGYKPYAFYDSSLRVENEKEGVHYGGYRDFDTPREAYAVLIDKVGKKGDWNSNPYVFVYDFELVK